MKGLLVALVFFGLLAFACGQISDSNSGIQSVTLVKGETAATPVVTEATPIVTVQQVEATPIVQQVAVTPVVTVQQVEATPIVQQVAVTPVVTVQQVQQPVAVPTQQQEVIVSTISSAASLSAFWMF